MHKSLLSMTIASAMLMLSSVEAHAHGWSEYPEARQQTCYNEGGFWSGTPASAGCAQAKAISGSYPFVQRNEFSINIADYNNMQTVKNAIPDGSLCYANDPQKRGMGAASEGWTRTKIQAGTFEYVFNATAPHNPSFWQFYLTKPSANLANPLAWDDLELLQEEGNIPVEGGKYRTNVTIPTDRVGDAILFVRWQRVDPVGEGFYNCSDIEIVNDDIMPPPVEPNPEPSAPYLVTGSQFIPGSITLASASVGDSVHYKIFNKNGEEHSSFSLVITPDNQNDWDRLLASQVNGWYEANYQGNVFIGRWHEQMKHYMYFKNDLHGNYFNAKDAGASAEFSITSEVSPITAVISPKVLKPLSGASVVHGDYVVLEHTESKGELTSIVWRQISGTPVPMTVGSNDELIIDTAQLANIRHELTFKLEVSDGQATEDEIYSFAIESSITAPVEPVPPIEPEEPGSNTWSAASTYTASDKVIHNGKTWTAQWWTQGEEPGTTGEWGVWR